MGYRNLDDEWAGLEPEQPRERRTGLIIGISLLVISLLVIIGVSGYLIWSQFQERTSPPVGAVTTAVPTATDTTAATPMPTDQPDEPTTAAATATLAPAATSTTAPAATVTPATVSSVEAFSFASPPTIDGTLAEWSDFPSYLSTYRVFAAGSWDGTDDLTAVWRLGWDANNLYIGVLVNDNVHVQTQSGNTIFRGDSVDMQFDTDRSGDFGDGLSPDDFQITFSPGDFGSLPPSAFRFQGTDSGAIRDAAGGTRVTVAAQPTDSGYTLEAAIPWSDLNLAPAPGLVIGLALNASDNDSPGTAVQEVMMSHVSTRTLTNPTTWGTLTLR